MNCDQNSCSNLATFHFVRVSHRARTAERHVYKEHAPAVLMEFKTNEPFEGWSPHEHAGAVQYDIELTFYDEAAPQQSGGVCWVYLRDLHSQRRLSFQTGYCESVPLSQALTGLSPPRPLTFPLIARIIEGLGERLLSVIVDDLSEPDHVFYTKLQILNEGRIVTIDARPSDATVLAVLFQAPIFVTNELLAKSGLSKGTGARSDEKRARDAAGGDA